MAATKSSPIDGMADQRETLRELFRLPQRSEAYPHEAVAWTKELALQMVTHPSAEFVNVGLAPHNVRLAFYGRRLLSLHFQLFLLEASRHAGPAAIAAGGGYFATPIPTRNSGPAENRMSGRGDGTAQGLEDAILGDDAVLGRHLGYAWSVKEVANWRYKQGYDSRAAICQSIVGGLAHAYVSSPQSSRVVARDGKGFGGEAGGSRSTGWRRWPRLFVGGRRRSCRVYLRPAYRTLSAAREDWSASSVKAFAAIQPSGHGPLSAGPFRHPGTWTDAPSTLVPPGCARDAAHLPRRHPPSNPGRAASLAPGRGQAAGGSGCQAGRRLGAGPDRFDRADGGGRLAAARGADRSGNRDGWGVILAWS
jgi:hypothetical protein